jgi:poly(A) polymerase
MKNTLPPPEWLKRPLIQAITAAFAEAGRPIRFVGGAVRDHLIGRPVGDIDAATTATPDETLALLKRARIKAIPTGLAHGTITAVRDRETLEITTLRRDVATDGRHAVVAFTDDWKEDAARRDFTINALYLTPEGTLYDYFGGQEDLARGTVRFIGEPSARIAEDYLRILRFFRFLATHGREPAEIGALAACESAALELLNLSAERIRQEMLKLLAAPDPISALELMLQTGVLPVVTGHAFEPVCLRPLLTLEQALHLKPHPLVRLACLLRAAGDAPSQNTAIAARWKLSGHEAALLQKLCVTVTDSLIDSHMVHRLLYAHGEAEGPLHLLLLAAEAGMNGRTLSPLWWEAAHWPVPRLPVSGEDLKARGIAAGPAMGKALRRLEHAWIGSDFTLTRETLLQLLTA